MPKRLTVDQEQWMRDNPTNIGRYQIADLFHEIDALREKLSDYDSAQQLAMSEECTADEQHCTCVPLLRTALARRDEVLEQVKSTIGKWIEPDNTGACLGPDKRDVELLLAILAGREGEK